MSAKKTMGYKGKLANASKLKTQSKAMLFARVQLLNDVFEDRQFRADLGNVDDFKCAAVLDEYVDDTDFNFLQLRGLLEMFPESHAWESRRLSDLYAELLDAKRRATRSSEPAVTKRRTVTVAQHDELAEEKKRLEIMHRRAREEAQAAATELEQLRAEVERLEAENRELKAENRRLQRLLKREGAELEAAAA